MKKHKARGYLLNQRKFILEILKSNGLQNANTKNKYCRNITLRCSLYRPRNNLKFNGFSLKQTDSTELKRIVCYFEGTKDFKLRLSRNGEPNFILRFQMRLSGK